MLEDCLVESRPSARTKKPLTVVVSGITHCVLIVALALVPLFQNQVLPQVSNPGVLRPPQARVTELVPTTQRPAAAPAPAPPSTDLIAPTEIPRDIVFVNETPQNVGFVPMIDGNVGGNGFFENFMRGPAGGAHAPALPPPPPQVVAAPPPPPPAPAPQAPVRTGGDVVKSNLIHQVMPAYPVLARQSRVEGVVVMEAIITRAGTIDSLRVVSGHVLLNQAAVDAVRQWRYRPTLLNGQPVEVITTITVSFNLD